MKCQDLTDDIVKEFREAFELFDRNADGLVTKEELRELLNDLGKNPTEDALTKMVRDVDSDNSGAIDFAEFLTHVTRKFNQKDHRGELTGAFQVFDRDGDGKVSPDDIEVVMGALGDFASLEECKQIVIEGDKDKDGMLSLDEFLSLMRFKI
eukprot:Plantae.Rhodophyta-Rhodochaete_pulchella.ctg32181.p1 GENE.Plantae.Rhodophyta-Rhodochaete_pulchella.ctg32181~~Plantae.Rhodophyta-Rhodochaete_pulchella.ctg32181.p1  ORF type:complete len:152 (+),score=48.65 Plantae.Rhodophyta-Rhodochaete_pulchella.ctg32181:87-542(+)